MTDSELVERLRRGDFVSPNAAADRLEQLAGEVAEAREALKDMLAAIKYADGCIDHLDCLEDYGESWHKAMERAKALGERKQP